MYTFYSPIGSYGKQRIVEALKPYYKPLLLPPRELQDLGVTDAYLRMVRSTSTPSRELLKVVEDDPVIAVRLGLLLPLGSNPPEVY